MERNSFVSRLFLPRFLLSAFTPESGGSAHRPRIEGDREQEILNATIEVLAEVGYDKLTMDAVAMRAKASKATLYRRWTGKETLVISALQARKGSHPDVIPDTGSLRGDLIGAYCGTGSLVDEEFSAIFTGVIHATMRDPELAAAWRREMVSPKLVIARMIWERACARGEVVNGEVDLELLEAVFSGVIMHRILVLGQMPDVALITKVVDQIILPALGASATAPAPSAL